MCGCYFSRNFIKEKRLITLNAMKETWIWFRLFLIKKWGLAVLDSIYDEGKKSIINLIVRNTPDRIESFAQIFFFVVLSSFTANALLLKRKNLMSYLLGLLKFWVNCKNLKIYCKLIRNFKKTLQFMIFCEFLLGFKFSNE